MIMSLTRPLLSLFAGLLGAGVEVHAQVPRSPFLRSAPEQVEQVDAPVENAEFQFCGTFGDGDAKRFLIYNKTLNRSTWLQVGEEGPDGLFIDDYDLAESTVVVRQGSQRLNLALQAATITPGAARAAAPVALTGTSSDLVKTVRVNPTPTDERRRLEAVAAEVRRRRELRQSASAGQTVAPPTHN